MDYLPRPISYETANVLNSFFTSVFTKESDSLVNTQS